jgi:hypothetical protein
MLARNRYALKEWAPVCERLGSGDQILLLRKGGLLERKEGFQVEHREFFLFPTRFHAEAEGPEERVELRLYATVEDEVRVDELDRLRALEGQHAVPWEDVEKRFHYGKERGVNVLALRAYRLTRPHSIDNARDYGGCRSWVELRSDLPVEHEGPVLSREAFRRKLEALQAALHG